MFKKKKKKIVIVIIIFIMVSIFFLFFYFSIFLNNVEPKKQIYLDKDNIEIIINEKKIEEIQSRLSELDIDLNDIIEELDL